MSEEEEGKRASKLPRRRQAPNLSARKFTQNNKEDDDSPNSKRKISFSHVNEIGNDVGLEIWKMIDEDSLEKIPKANHGYFMSDKTYILLSTKLSENYVDKDYNIHIWIGEVAADNSSLISAADDKVSELEYILKNPIAKVHKEIQNKESEIFRSYFKNIGINYVQPIILTKIAKLIEFRKRLFQISGKRHITTKEVEITYKSLNKGDVFVLDTEDTIYQWNGSLSNRMKKGRALDFTVRIRDERSAKAKVKVLDELGEDDPQFWKELGGKGAVADAKDDEDEKTDAAPSRANRNNPKPKSENDGYKLYRVDKAGASVKLNLIEGVLNNSKLDTNGCFILDCGNEIFYWYGKASSTADRAAALSKAKEMGSARGVTPNREMQGCETTLFKCKFVLGKWNEFVENYDKTVKGNIAKKQEQEAVNVDAMHNPDKYSIAREDSHENTMFPLSGTYTGEIKVWYVKDHKKWEIPEDEYGTFYIKTCYIILYTITLNGGGHRNVLYYWQGRKASQDDKGACALLSKELAHLLGKNCIQARVVQNKEPKHFLSHFKGRMVVKKGRRDDVKELNNYEALFQVRGDDEINTRAIQVDLDATSLDTNDSFILASPKGDYLWNGNGSGDEERIFAFFCAQYLFPEREFEEIEEGQEPEIFWKILGGKAQYLTNIRPPLTNISPKLFHCSANTGIFKVVEVPNFSQDDLDDEDVMILDTGYEVFVWIGANSSEQEHKMSLETVMEYVKSAPKEKSDNPLYVVYSGNEPLEFTSNFHAWDADVTLEPDRYIKKLQEIMVKMGVMFDTNSVDLISLATEQISNSGGNSSDSTNNSLYTYERLKKKPLPDGIDTKNLHHHLLPEEFLKAFKMTREEFEKLPKWKQIETRKTVNLF